MKSIRDKHLETFSRMADVDVQYSMGTAQDLLATFNLCRPQDWNVDLHEIRRQSEMFPAAFHIATLDDKMIGKKQLGHHGTNQWRIQDFPEEAPSLRGANLLFNQFFRKLHENEYILVGGEGVASLGAIIRQFQCWQVEIRQSLADPVFNGCVLGRDVVVVVTVKN